MVSSYHFCKIIKKYYGGDNLSIYSLRIKKRMAFAFLVFIVFFIVIAIRLTTIQAFNSINLTEEQINQMMGEVPLTAARGIIYDRNMNVLTKDASASAIYARPKQIKNPNEIADYLSEILKLDKEVVYKKITDNSNWITLIKRKVDNEIAFKIKEKNLKGIEITEDKKRYYTNGNFAPYVLGFTGTEHKGLYGIESVYDDVLSGVDGILVYEKDGKGQKVPSGYQAIIEAKSGNNIQLTIDSIIQHFLETQAEKAFSELNAKRVIAIAMDPKTGDILAMTSKPDYNLNDPNIVPQIFNSKFEDEFIDNNGKPISLGKKQLFVWQNPAVSLNYEPGSTFKAITASAFLEEGVVTAQTLFYDKGFVDINGVKIKAHNYPKSFGEISFAKGVQYSSNPVLVESIQRLESDKFYKYIYNFGLGDKTRIELDGEQSGIVPPYDDNLLNYVTKSYGQGISATPIQMISALSAIVNDGRYMQPNIVKQILSSEKNEVIKEVKPKEIRQVISEDTADIVIDIMDKVVNESNNLSKLANVYRIGGKTGTAQKVIDGKYAKGTYITSFFGFAPVDEPKISVLLIVDEPNGSSVTGSSTAAPAAIEFINNTLNYLEVPSNDSMANFENNSIIPDFRGKDIGAANEYLKKFNLQYKIIGDKQRGIIVNQNPMPGKPITKETVVQLTIGDTVESDKKANVTVPNVKDMTIQQANESLSRIGLKLTIKGTGGISEIQAPKAGQKVKVGSKVVVEFKPVK